MDDIYPDRPRAAEDYAARRRERQAERKLAARRARRAGMRRAVTYAGIAGLAIVVVAGTALAALAVEPLRQGTRLAADAHRIVAQVDALISGEPGVDAAEQARGIAERVPAARTLLDRAIAQRDRVNPAVAFVWRPAARLEQRARAERAMLEPAPALLEVTAQSASARPLAQQGWESMRAAEDETGSAVVPKGKRTAKRLKAAVRAADAASTDLNLARERFAAAEAAFPAAPLEAYADYIGLLQQLNRARRQANQAQLEGRESDAKDARGTAKELVARVTEARDQLPASVDAAIESGVTDASTGRLAIYETARMRAAQASP